MAAHDITHNFNLYGHLQVCLEAATLTHWSGTYPGVGNFVGHYDKKLSLLSIRYCYSQ